MNANPLASATQGQNNVTLLSMQDPGVQFYVVTLHVVDVRGVVQHWARTDSDIAVARELYDQAAREFIMPDPPLSHQEASCSLAR